MHYPRISIVTPNFNGAAFLEYTIKSVLEQKYPNLEYIIVDGGSTDESLKIIKKYEQHIAYWISEKDNGMYEAIQKGFDKSTGTIMGWLNADDILHKESLFKIAQLFERNPKIEWIEGINTLFDAIGNVTAEHIPSNRNIYFNLLQLYNNRNFGFIQQESTYWKRSLWEKAGARIETRLKFAGDYELWMRFYRHSSLFIAKTFIGGFRVSGENQLSIKNAVQYIEEVDEVNQKTLASLSNRELKKLKTLKITIKLLYKLPKVKYFLIKIFLTRAFKNQKIS